MAGSCLSPREPGISTRSRRASWTLWLRRHTVSLAGCRSQHPSHHVVGEGVMCDGNPNSQTVFCSWFDWVHRHLTRGHRNPGPGRIPATSIHGRFWHSEGVSRKRSTRQLNLFHPISIPAGAWWDIKQSRTRWAEKVTTVNGMDVLEQQLNSEEMPRPYAMGCPFEMRFWKIDRSPLPIRR